MTSGVAAPAVGPQQAEQAGDGVTPGVNGSPGQQGAGAVVAGEDSADRVEQARIEA